LYRSDNCGNRLKNAWNQLCKAPSLAHPRWRFALIPNAEVVALVLAAPPHGVALLPAAPANGGAVLPAPMPTAAAAPAPAAPAAVDLPAEAPAPA
jgi:hypothetical protein